MTLTAVTNRLSLWAVMIAPPASINWAAVTGGPVVAGLLVYFVVLRKRRPTRKKAHR